MADLGDVLRGTVPVPPVVWLEPAPPDDRHDQDDEPDEPDEEDGQP